jgi:hypothetical protein
MFKLPIIPPQFKLIAIGVLAIACFVAGWQTHGWKLSHDQARSIARTEKVAQNAIVKADKITDGAIKAQAQQTIVYKTIREKVYEKNDNRVCFDADSLSLWNRAIAGTDSPRPQPTSESTTTETADNQTATVKDVLLNGAENYETCNKVINWHNALVDVLDVYKGNMCVCSQ